MKYKVIQEYTDTPASPITIAKGELLQLIKESEPQGDWPNWIFCKGKKKEGWVPKQILDIQNKTAIAISDYSAHEHTLSKGEILIPIYELNGWIWCCKESNPDKSGWAPLNHLRKL